jgi:phosphopantothenoylcysteine decarboxylase/phosphopantothenate--cysteine ligase
MVAAVADYTPSRPLTRKKKKSQSDLVLRLKPTVDIVHALARTRRTNQVVIGFALEDRNPHRNAEEKLRRKGLNAIVLNAPTALGADRGAWEVLVQSAAPQWVRFRRMTKTRMAAHLVALAERLHSDLPVMPRRAIRQRRNDSA